MIGVTVYHNGHQAGKAMNKMSHTKQPGSGVTLIGRRFSNFNNKFASVAVDELAIWNRALSGDNVMQIFRKCA